MYIAVIQSLQNSPSIAESPTLPEVTTNSTVVNENTSSIPEGIGIYVATIVYVCIYTHNNIMYSIV